jgi:beta-lactamase regulating signal transducer with metallopeptidase domain
VIVVYLAGVAVCGVRLTAGLLLVGRLRRRSTPVEGLPLDWIREAAGETDAVVCTHTRVQVPIAVGWRHPIVILPESWLACDRARLAAVLRHELSHVTRRDFAWNVLGAVFHAVFWFSPAAWLVVRRIRLTSELAADRSAADALGRAPYARMLLDSARDLLHARSAGMLAPSAAAVLEARVAALTGADDEPPQATARTRRLAAALVAALLLSTAVVQLGTSAAPPAPGDHDARHQIRHAQH